MKYKQIMSQIEKILFYSVDLKASDMIWNLGFNAHYNRILD